MKPFDLKAAMRGEPVMFRNGEIYTFGAHNPRGMRFSKIVGWKASGVAIAHSEEGSYGSAEPHYFDLFMAPTKRELWVRAYKAKEETGPSGVLQFPSEQMALSANSCLYSAAEWFGPPVKVAEWDE